MSRFLTTYAETAAALRAHDKSDELCCVFAQSWTRRLYGQDVVGRAPAKLWCLWPESGDAWGPVTACVQAGIGELVATLVPGRWHRVQGWRGTPFAPGVTGHTFTVYACDAGVAMVFDSAADRNERAAVVNWPQYAAQYRGGIKIAALKEP